MLKVVLSNQFKKDVVLARKRGLKLDQLYETVDLLASGEPLPKKYQDHQLIGNYSGFRECHIRPNWLLIYNINDEELELLLFRTGTHSDLLKK